MKYELLTKEQFESLHDEFSKFLATQSIDKSEWEGYKAENPAMVNEQLSIFSDIVWEDVLTRTHYLEHFSKNVINLFKCEASQIVRIVIKTEDENIDFNQKEGYEWLFKNINSDKVELFNGTKNYATERNTEIFDLIQKGSVISKGTLFSYFNKIIH